VFLNNLSSVLRQTVSPHSGRNPIDVHQHQAAIMHRDSPLLALAKLAASPLVAISSASSF
jgi:hypothetical protein